LPIVIALVGIWKVKKGAMRARASSISNIISIALLDRAHNTFGFSCFSGTSSIPSLAPLRSPFDIMSKRPSRPQQQQQQQSSKHAKTQQSLSGYFGTTSRSSTTTTSSDTTSTIVTTTISTTTAPSSKYKIFCDLDGVLVDFNAGVKKICNGRTPDELPNQSIMWSAISKADQFYTKLPWTDDGERLWEELKNHSTTPDILTGVPMTIRSRAEKFAWCKRELGISVNHVDMAGKKSTHELVSGRRQTKMGVVNVITCWSKNKHYESKANHVLIDDRLSLQQAWEERGGIFIHHTSTERTLAMLRERGVLASKCGDSVAVDKS
jgi:hypothetical protein